MRSAHSAGDPEFALVAENAVFGPQLRPTMTRMVSSKQTDLLVRAFKTAWIDYYQFGRSDAVSPEAARPALAQFLVDKARDGMMDEAALASAGLDLLFSLETPAARPAVDDAPRTSVGEPSWTLRLESARARFLRVEHVGPTRQRRRPAA